MYAGLTPWEIGLWGLRPQLWYDPAKVGASTSFISSTSSIVHCMPLRRMHGCMNWSQDRADSSLIVLQSAGSALCPAPAVCCLISHQPSLQVVQAWELLLNSADSLRDVQPFLYDLVDVGRQVRILH